MRSFYGTAWHNKSVNDNLIPRNDHCLPELTDQSTSSTPRVLVEDLVRIVARVLALSYSDCSEDAENCLLCHHGPPHSHSTRHHRSGTDHRSLSASTNHCMVARLSQCALNMGLSCPNRHYASRSLQIFRVLGAHLDSKTLSKLVARLGETIADSNEELQVTIRMYCFNRLDSANENCTPLKHSM